MRADWLSAFDRSLLFTQLTELADRRRARRGERRSVVELSSFRLSIGCRKEGTSVVVLVLHVSSSYVTFASETTQRRMESLIDRLCSNAALSVDQILSGGSRLFCCKPGVVVTSAQSIAAQDELIAVTV